MKFQVDKNRKATLDKILPKCMVHMIDIQNVL